MSNQYQPLVWKGIPRPTVGDLLDAAFEVTDDAEAQKFMDAYRAVNPHADANIGYILGYVEPAERRREMYELFALTHPVFGGVP